jgi:hypothetical protein
MLRYANDLTEVNLSSIVNGFGGLGRRTTMQVKRDMSIPQLARELGVSRVSVWNKVKTGQIPAQKVGGRYVIRAKDADVVLGRSLTQEHRVQIHDAVGRVVREYGPVLKRLSRE